MPGYLKSTIRLYLLALLLGAALAQPSPDAIVQDGVLRQSTPNQNSLDQLVQSKGQQSMVKAVPPVNIQDLLTQLKKPDLINLDTSKLPSLPTLQLPQKPQLSIQDLMDKLQKSGGLPQLPSTTPTLPQKKNITDLKSVADGLAKADPLGNNSLLMKPKEVMQLQQAVYPKNFKVREGLPLAGPSCAHGILPVALADMHCAATSCRWIIGRAVPWQAAVLTRSQAHAEHSF